jgi:hypothetical protein
MIIHSIVEAQVTSFLYLCYISHQEKGCWGEKSSDATFLVM